MTTEEKLDKLTKMLGDGDYDTDVLVVYLDQAKEKILNKRFPFGTDLIDVEPKYEQLQLELTIVLYNQRGVEGQSDHSENGVSRKWKTENAILDKVIPVASLPL